MNIKASCKDARLTLRGVSCQYEGLRLTLKASNTEGDRSSLGTCHLDMMHLIVLIAEPCQVVIPDNNGLRVIKAS